MSEQDFRGINDLPAEDFNAIREWIHHPAGDSGSYIVDIKPDTPDGKKTKYPLSKQQITDTTIEIDKDSFIDLQIEPPKYKQPGISIKRTGIVKINAGLIRELMDAGGFVYFLGCGVVNKKYITFYFLNSEGLIRHWEREKEKPKDEAKLKVYYLKDHGKRIGELHLGKALTRAELNPETDIGEYELRPDPNHFTSRDFGPDSLSFDRGSVQKHQLIKVILDPTKGESFNRSRGGKIPLGLREDLDKDGMTPKQQKAIEKFKEAGGEEITPEWREILDEIDVDELEKEMDAEDAKVEKK